MKIATAKLEIIIPCLDEKTMNKLESQMIQLLTNFDLPIGDQKINKYTNGKFGEVI